MHNFVKIPFWAILDEKLGFLVLLRRNELKILVYDNFYTAENRAIFSGTHMMRNLKRFVEQEEIEGWDITNGKIIDTT